MKARPVSFWQFEAKLRRNQMEDQLWDRIVQRIQDEQVLKDLMEEKDLTLDKAIAICLARESAMKGAQVEAKTLFGKCI